MDAAGVSVCVWACGSPSNNGIPIWGGHNAQRLLKQADDLLGNLFGLPQRMATPYCYVLALYSPPLYLSAASCASFLFIVMSAHTNISPSLLPTCFLFQQSVNLGADDGRANLIFAATFRGRAVFRDFMSVRGIKGASVYHTAQC